MTLPATPECATIDCVIPREQRWLIDRELVSSWHGRRDVPAQRRTVQWPLEPRRRSGWSSDLSERPLSEAQIARVEVTVLPMPDMPNVLLRTPTDDGSWMCCSASRRIWTPGKSETLWAPVPLTRERFDARRALAAENTAPDQVVRFVIDVDGTAVGDASLFEFDSFARHAEAGIDWVAQAPRHRHRNGSDHPTRRFWVRAPKPPPNPSPGDRLEQWRHSCGTRRPGLWSRAGSANMLGSEERTRTSC